MNLIYIYRIGAIIFALVIWLAFIATPTWAQTDSLSSVKSDSTTSKNLSKYAAPRFVIKYSITSLLELPPYIQIGAENRLDATKYLHYEVGVIMPEAGYIKYKRDDLFGVRLRTNFRWYPGSTVDDRKDGFIGPELLFKYEQWKNQQWVLRAGGAYREFIPVNYKKYVVGLNFMFGASTISKNHRLALDFVTGVGVKRRFIVKEGNFSEDDTLIVTDSDIFWDSDFNRNGVFFNLVLGIKLGIVIDP